MKWQQPLGINAAKHRIKKIIKNRRSGARTIVFPPLTRSSLRKARMLWDQKTYEKMKEFERSKSWIETHCMRCCPYGSFMFVPLMGTIFNRGRKCSASQSTVSYRFVTCGGLSQFQDVFGDEGSPSWCSCPQDSLNLWILESLRSEWLAD
jgi:hypothetical protein